MSMTYSKSQNNVYYNYKEITSSYSVITKRKVPIACLMYVGSLFKMCVWNFEEARDV